MGALERRYAEALIAIAESARNAECPPGGSTDTRAIADSGTQKQTSDDGTQKQPSGAVIQQPSDTGAQLSSPALPFCYARLMESLDTVLSVYESGQGFEDVMAEPFVAVSIKEKEAIIEELFAGRIEVEIVNLMKLLARKGRIRLLPGIRDEYQQAADERSNILRIRIVTATPLDNGQLEMIAGKYREESGAFSVRIFTSIDKSIGGGIKVTVGDRTDDASVVTRLGNLKKSLMSD